MPDPRAAALAGPRPSLLFPLHHPHDPLLRQVTAWIAYPLRPDTEPIAKTWTTSVHSRTDSRGRFHFRDVPAGTFRVTATVPGRPGSGAEAEIELPEGREVPDVELCLALGDPIRGEVRRPDGSPAIGAFVQVAGTEDRARIRATTGAGGRFELLGVTEAMGPVELFTIVASYNWHHPDARLGASVSVARARGGAGRRRSPAGARPAHRDGRGRHRRPRGRGRGPGDDLDGAARIPAAVLARSDTADDGAFLLELPESAVVDLVATVPRAASWTPPPAMRRPPRPCSNSRPPDPSPSCASPDLPPQGHRSAPRSTPTSL